ncbi:hypothetical protein GmRootV59_48100 [Variovorax sp. V59]
MNGLRLDGRPSGAGGRGRGHGRRAGPAWRAEECGGNGARGRIVIGLEALYGFGALVAVLLFAYLVFALICAEEF